MGRHGVVAFLLVLGCAETSVVQCEDGRTCPAGTVCEDIRGLCIQPEQTMACAQLFAGQVCTAAGVAGICERELCLPGCGDGLVNGDEECDDGDFASNDGCSSSCLVEIPSWSQWHDRWRGLQGHSTAFDPFIQRLVVIGGTTELGTNEQQWHRRNAVDDPAHGWETAETDRAATINKPPARSFAGMVYDTARSKLVLFGGVAANSAPLNDTWEFDPTLNKWSQRTVSASPSPRLSSTMVFDPTRNRIVLFGGVGLAGPLDDTWELVGNTWVDVSNTTRPPSRNYGSMTWDAGRGRAVLFGGVGEGLNFSLTDTWEYEAGTWTVAATTGPPARYQAAMAYFPLRNSVVLFGGRLFDPFLNAGDTWEYTNGTWTRLTTTIAPPARSNATLTHNPDAGSNADAMILIGGTDDTGSKPLDDVWELSINGRWTPRTPRFHPEARTAPAAYDEVAQEVVVVGGVGDYLFGDVWAFNGEVWRNLRIPNGPSPRLGHSMSYDPVRKRVIVFGGNSQPDGTTFGVTDETYEWAERTWTKVVASAPGLPRTDAALAFDGTSNVTVAFGGMFGASSLADTWEYDGTAWTKSAATGPTASRAPVAAWDPTARRLVLVDEAGVTWTYANHAWTQLVPATDGPPARFSAAMTYDWGRRRLLLAGGIAAGTGEYLTDIWELDGAVWSRLYVPGLGPLPRTSFGFASHKVKRSTVLFGGTTTGSRTNDTWLLQFGSDTALENCVDGVDNDGDLQVDGGDPDCCATVTLGECLE